MNEDDPIVIALQAIARMQEAILSWHVARWNAEYPPGHAERSKRIPQRIKRIMAQQEDTRQVGGS